MVPRTASEHVVHPLLARSGKVEEHHLAPEQLEDLDVQRHVKAEEGNDFDLSERKTIKISFEQLIPCDLIDLDLLRQY